MRNPVRTPKQKRPRTNTHGNSHRAVLSARSRVAAQPYADIGHMARNRAPTRPASPKPKQTPDVPAPQGHMIQTHGQSASAKPNPGESSSPTRHLFHCPPLRDPWLRTHGLSVASASPSFQERTWWQVREDPHRFRRLLTTTLTSGPKSPVAWRVGR